MIHSIEKGALEIISPKCSQKNCDLRFFIIYNFFQKKACCFIFDCLLRMELLVSRLGTIFNNFIIMLKHWKQWEKQQNCPR